MTDSIFVIVDTHDDLLGQYLKRDDAEKAIIENVALLAEHLGVEEKDVRSNLTVFRSYLNTLSCL